MDSVLEDVLLPDSDVEELGAVEGEDVMRSGEEEREGEKEESLTTYETHKSGGELLSTVEEGEEAEKDDGGTTYDSHKGEQELLSGDFLSATSEVDEVDFADFLTQPDETHKSGKALKKKQSAATIEESEESAAEPEDRWVEKEQEGDMFVVERQPPLNAVKFTPCVVGAKKNLKVVIPENFDPMSDCDSVCAKLPKGICEVKMDTMVCFHPRQFHYVEVGKSPPIFQSFLILRFITCGKLMDIV